MSEDKFTILDDNGVSREYYKLMQFESNKTNKEYIIYTDSIDSENIHGSIIDEVEGKLKFIPIETEIDKEEIKKAIIKFNIEKEQISS